MRRRSFDGIRNDLLAGARDRAATLSREELEREYLAMFENLTAMQTAHTREKNVREEVCTLAIEIVDGSVLIPGPSAHSGNLIKKFRETVAKLPRSSR